MTAATPPGTPITNLGYVQYTSATGAASIASNEVSLAVAPPPSRATLTLLRSDPARGAATPAAATACVSPNGVTPLPPPVASDGQVLSLTQPLPLTAATTVHGGEAVFLDLLDPDRNRDATLIDYVDVTLTAATGDVETVRLAESAVDSGRFIGYVQTQALAAQAGNCMLEVERDADLVASYTDPADATDTANATALVDPFGLVFDSRTGAPVDGARVRLVDAVSGADASVLGDDGVSAFPAEIVTGQPVTDAGGTVYTFPAGVFRFPLVAGGDYRLVVEPPTDYAFPSTVPEIELQALPNAPFRLSTASVGATFTAAAGATEAIDVPLDATSSVLFLEKTTPVTVASLGDFVPYTLGARNASDFAPLDNVVLTDVLPPGMRYRAGSARLDTGTAIEPAIAGDGATLTFRLGTLPPGGRATLRYVAVVGAGTSGGTLVNRAVASADNGAMSNSAAATVLLREELFTSAAILMGRVIEGACDTPIEAGTGVAGVRVYLEDGRYALTDDEGKYHFEGLPPGAHVVQIDRITLPLELETQRCETRVRGAQSAISQFVDLRGGALATADFRLARRAPPTGDAQLSLTTEEADGDFAHAATVTARGVALTDAELLVMLPTGVDYVPGSARRDGAPIDDPPLSSGVLRIALGDVAADQAVMLELATREGRVPSRVADLPVQAVLRFSTPTEAGQRTEPVKNVLHRDAAVVENESYMFTPHFNALQTQMASGDRAELDRIAAIWAGVDELDIQVIGHADQTPIAARNRARFPDNYALSAARAQVVADYLRERLQGARFVVEGRGAEEPIALGTDPESLARNRRVEIRIAGVRTVKEARFRLLAGEAASPPVATTGVFGVGARNLVGAPVSARTPGAAAESPVDIASVEPRVAWFRPAEGYTPGVPSLRVTIAHLPEQSVALTVNGRAVSPLNFDGTETNAAGSVTLSRWRGVDLVDGENRLVATVHDAAGNTVTELTRTIRYGSGGVRAELVPEQSVLTADGRTQPVVALRIFDASGAPARPGTLGAYSVDPPYRTWWEVETLRDNPLLTAGRREPTFTVEEDGIVRVLLEPTAQTGTVVVRLRFNERQSQEIRAWLTPEQRDWILVGIAEGTTAYNRLSEALAPPDVEEGYASDGRIAFFAKGRVKGSTLLTIAYDSERDRALAEERLYGVIEPDRYYTLYGDSVEQRFEAASTRKLYLKIERRQFAALFGDFETGLTITELGRYSRSLTGFKTDFAGEHATVSAFAADNREAYGRDELRGDGTSGPYRLSRGSLVANSDKLRIEVRDRIRSEVVVDTRVLSRFIDYSIDYSTGILTFKEPIPSRDSSFNPVYVIAEYETLDRDAGSTTAGARATTRLAGDKLELGATVVNEGATTGDTRLAATDLRYRPTGALEVRAEAAATSSEDPLRGSAGAYLAEVTRVTERLDLKAYVREQEQGFGVGQQLATEAGTRKVGVDARTKIGERWQARGEAFHQSNLATQADRELVATEARRETDDTTLSLGLRHVLDTLPATGERRSDLVSAGGSLDVLGDRITLRALTEQAVGSRDESLDFPERTTLGLDYHVTEATSVFVEHENASSAQIDSTMTRVGVRTTPWAGTQISSSVNHEFSEYGPRVFANVGLTQSWRLGDAWSMDLGVDQSETLTTPGVERFDDAVPLVSGNLGGDYRAAFIGGQYRADVWTFTSRVEQRHSDLADRLTFVTGFFREPIEGRALSLTARVLDNDAAQGDGRIADARFSYAFRPSDSRFIVLNRLDLQRDERTDALLSLDTARFVNNLNLHWQVGNRFEVGTQIGARYVQSSIDGVEYSGWSELLGFDVRRDLTRVLDFGFHGTWLTADAAGTSQRSAGVDVGINAARNLWLSVGYNFEGFRDDNFDASRYTAQGPYVRFRFKVDQDTFRDLDLSGLRPGGR